METIDLGPDPLATVPARLPGARARSCSGRDPLLGILDSNLVPVMFRIKERARQTPLLIGRRQRRS